MTRASKDSYIYRAESVIFNIRRFNGADIHQVGNMRNIASLLIQAIQTGLIDEVSVADVLKRLETQQYEFFRKKFSKD